MSQNFNDKPKDTPINLTDYANKNVIDIEEAKPHITINGLDAVHVVPLSLIEDVAKGKVKLSDVEMGDSFIPTLLAEWLMGR